MLRPPMAGSQPQSSPQMPHQQPARRLLPGRKHLSHTAKLLSPGSGWWLALSTWATPATTILHCRRVLAVSRTHWLHLHHPCCPCNACGDTCMLSIAEVHHASQCQICDASRAIRMLNTDLSILRA